jgi:hypothetical protein
MIGLPVPNIRMTTDRPIKTNRAVPANSEKHSCQGNGLALWSFIVCESSPDLGTELIQTAELPGKPTVERAKNAKTLREIF